MRPRRVTLRVSVAPSVHLPSALDAGPPGQQDRKHGCTLLLLHTTALGRHGLSCSYQKLIPPKSSTSELHYKTDPDPRL